MTRHKQIGEVAYELGINPKTIRYYEEIGLIPPAPRTEAGYRMYGQADVDRLAFILRARELDFSLDDIGEILALREEGEAPCLYVMELVQQQLANIDAKVAALNQLRRELVEIQRQAQSIPPDVMANKDCVCHLLENQTRN
jgi:DNA-binding transcriptional MerR regulator